MAPSRSSILLPFLLACVGIALFSAMDAVMKGLSIAIGAYLAMLWRTMLGALIAGTVFLVRREKLPQRSTLRLHLLRGSIAAAMAIAFFWGIARVPLAEGIALSFIAPLITLYLAAVLLGEQVSKGAIIASVLGIAGVGVILSGRMGQGGDMGPDAVQGILAILVSAVLYAYNLILQRQQAQVATPVEIAFFQSLIVASVLAVAGTALNLLAPLIGQAPPVPISVPDASHWPAIIGAALLALVSVVLLSWAYARAEAQALVAVEYTAFIWAALLGWWMFGEAVTLPLLAGTLLIIAGCVIVARQKPETPPVHVEATAL
jgi:S-adenosylmethionine uptake transporter